MSAKRTNSKSSHLDRPVKPPAGLLTKARQARGRAYAPYSGFQVGAALLTANGDIYSGCNIENASYGGTVCAERVAILKAISEKKMRFTDLLVVTDAPEPAFPCGLCLQTMAEFFAPNMKIWIADMQGVRYQMAFSALLARPFGPAELKQGKRAKRGSRR